MAFPTFGHRKGGGRNFELTQIGNCNGEKVLRPAKKEFVFPHGERERKRRKKGTRADGEGPSILIGLHRGTDSCSPFAEEKGRGTEGRSCVLHERDGGL